MAKYNYELVSEAVILRDITEPEYKDKEHKMLVDIADTLYNANIGAEYLKPEYKALYDEYGAEYWGQVIDDASAIDSQLAGHEAELIEEYKKLLTI